MTTPRRSVVLVVLGVLGASVAGAYYFFFVFTRDEALHEARAQVSAWDERWQAARACLLGSVPLAADLHEALVLSELVGARGARDCARDMGKLTRPEGNASHQPEVEEAWAQLEVQVIAAAQVYVQARRSPERFAEALHRVRKARSTLRRLVELPMEDAPMGPAPRPVVTTPLTLAGKPVSELVVNRAGQELLGRLVVEERWHQGRVARAGAGLEVTAVPVSPEVVASGVAPTWGLRAVFDERDASRVRLFAGALDGQGELVAPTELAAAPGLLPAAALGAELERIALHVTSTEPAALHRSRSSDGGKSWRTESTPWAQGYVLPDAAGAADVVYQSAAESSVVWQRVAVAAPEGEPVRVAGVALLATCATGAAPWVLLSESEGVGARVLRRLDLPAQAVPAPDTASSILACDDKAVLLGADSGEAVGCTATACAGALGVHGDGFAVVSGGVPQLVRAQGPLLAALSPSGPRVARLPAGVELVGAHALGGELWLIAQGAGGALVAARWPE